MERILKNKGFILVDMTTLRKKTTLEKNNKKGME
jgi:hypothetical protein